MTVTGLTSITHSDTIAALATPPGVGGLAVIRVSGDRAIECVAEIFQGNNLRNAASHTVHFGRVVGTSKQTLDEVMAAVFRAPASYTGEDTVEISCHGGATAYRAILERLFSAAVRHAEAGEFTRRAFLNGKMDLVQAEAVADLIHAQSDAAHHASVRQLEGRLSAYIAEIRSALLHCLGMIELSLDFVEEDVEFLTSDQLQADLTTAAEKLQKALDTFKSGRLIRDGIKVVLVGKPNVGKSSILNALLGAPRAIVTNVPGTTRDFIEEQMMLHGKQFRFVDTAGLRETSDTIEKMGIAIGREQLADADIVCGIVDNPASGSDIADLRQIAMDMDAQFIAIQNKNDLYPDDDIAEDEVIRISALHAVGLKELTQRLAEIANELSPTLDGQETLVTNSRHAACLARGLAALQQTLKATEQRHSEELLAYELRSATDALGEIIGAVTTDDILNGIFSRFCIGK